MAITGRPNTENINEDKTQKFIEDSALYDDSFDKPMYAEALHFYQQIEQGRFIQTTISIPGDLQKQL